VHQTWSLMERECKSYEPAFSGKRIRSEFWLLGLKWGGPVWTVTHVAEQKVVETLKVLGTAAIRCILLGHQASASLDF